MKRLMVVCLTLGLLLAVSATAPVAPKQITLGLALKTLNNPFYVTVKEHAEEAAKKYPNVKVICLAGVDSGDLDAQMKYVEDFIQRKVDLIGIAAVDAKGIIPAIEKANKAGIPVVTVDTNADGGKIECFIGTDNYKGGLLGGQWIVETLGGKGKVALLEGVPGSQVNRDRMAGFKDAIAKAPGIKLVASVPAHFRRDTGMKVMEDVLTANPDLDAVMCLNDEMALGAMEAIKARRKMDQVLNVGFNGADEAVLQVYKGNMAADVVQYPEAMGRLFVEWALKILNGEKPPQFHIDSGVDIVDTQLLQKVVPACAGK